MNRKVYRYNFKTDADFSEALNSFDLAVVAVEAIYGEARVRIECRYADNPQTRRIAIMADTDVGNAVNLVFTKFAIVEFGIESFTIDHVFRPETIDGIQITSEDRAAQSP